MITILKRLCLGVACAGILIAPQLVSAQDDNVTIPNVVGLSLPQAAALLNTSGLNLGTETKKPWSADSGQKANTVGAQAIPPGQAVKRGSALDVTVLRAPNVQLVYDDNLLTFTNHTGAELTITDLTFNTIDGSAPAAFKAITWQADTVSDGECVQLWAVGHDGSQAVEGCSTVDAWYSTVNPSSHFWIAANGTTRFNVMQGDQERGTCATVAPGAAQAHCDIYLISPDEDAAAYVYFAYTTDQLVVKDKSPDMWMPLAGTAIVNNAPPVKGSTFAFGDPKIFGNPAIMGRIDKLAPGQCLLYTKRDTPGEDLPETCAVLARLDLDPNVIFWDFDFGVQSVTDDLNHVCPAATPGKLTICAMPR